MELHWAVEENPAGADIQILRTRLSRDNVQLGHINTGHVLAVFIRDEGNHIVGGVYGWVWGACIEVQFLWVQVDWRGQGFGTKLMHTLESEAVCRGVTLATLDTYSFQFPGFYRKLGYQAFGVIAGYPNGYEKIYFQKKLE